MDHLYVGMVSESLPGKGGQVVLHLDGYDFPEARPEFPDRIATKRACLDEAFRSDRTSLGLKHCHADERRRGACPSVPVPHPDRRVGAPHRRELRQKRESGDSPVAEMDLLKGSHLVKSV